MKKILVAEDDKYLGNAYRVKLSKAGFEVRLALDGEEALRILPEFSPDIILLDLIMPVKDGFSVLEDLRQDDHLRQIPVIIATNLGQKEDIEKGMNLGATDYIVKSDTPLEEIIAKINKILAA